MMAVKEEPAVADGQESKFEQGLLTELSSGGHPHFYWYLLGRLYYAFSLQP